MRSLTAPSGSIRSFGFRAFLWLFGILLMCSATESSAQYMYLDSNGDGINTAEDQLSATGATHVTVWLDTAHDRDGTAVSCNSHTGAPSDNQPLDLFEYTVTLEAVGADASVTWGTFADSLGGFIPLDADRMSSTAYVFDREGGFQAKPQGLYKLGSIDVTVASGAPSLRISPGVLDLSSSYTLFGGHCPATDNPNSYTLGIDWFDTNGLGAPSTVVTPYAARVFSTNSGDTFRLRSGKPTLCVQIEPVDADYENASVELHTLTMLSSGTGTVDQIPAISDKTSVAADRDRNGVEEITACFARADLENLFSQIHGHENVTVTLEGRLTSGRIFRGTTTLSVIGNGNGASLHASVSPNPLNPEATLRFVTDRPAAIRVRVFDVGGRMVRELVNDPSAPAGAHAVRIDGTGMPSGVYLYRIDSSTKAVTGRFAILK